MILSKKSLTILILTCLSCIAFRCAQVVPLTGGDKDTKAPELISVIPANKSTHVPTKNTKIVFKFSEMVAAPTVSQKLMINPLIDELPDVLVNGKTVTVEFIKELLPNTTYLLQFGNSIVDIHENNAFSNLTYIFSTGPTIDTASISGEVTYALTQKPIADISLMLYKDLSDSAPLRSKPDYFTKTDENGKYYLSAIKPGKYQAIALSDKSKNTQYDAGEAIGFLNAPVSVKNDTLNFLLSVSKSENIFIKKKNQVFWGYNRYILNDTFPEAYIITAKSVDGDNISFETRNDTLEVYYKGMHSVNLELRLKNNKKDFDTVNIFIPEKTRVDSSLEKGMKKISFLTEKTLYAVKHDDVILNFSLPVKRVDSEKCFLIRDSIKVKPVFTSENTNEENTLVTTYMPQYKKRLTNNLLPQKTYTLLCLPQSIETFWGTFNKDTIKVSFKTFSADELGNLQVKLLPEDSIRGYVLQLLNAKSSVVNEFAAVNKKEYKLNFYNLPAGDYLLRLVKDDDGNKKFTPAGFLKHTQAELVWYYNKPLKILAGWDIEAEWNTKGAK